jgi:hypothetical protein
MTEPTIAPPQGYRTWLDYAVATMDVRAAQQAMNGLCDDAQVVDPLPSYDDIRAAAAAELGALRTAA